MSARRFGYILHLILLCLLGTVSTCIQSTSVYAQANSKKVDSLRAVAEANRAKLKAQLEANRAKLAREKEVRDSTLQANKKRMALESAARKRAIDSTIKSRTRIRDSVAKVRLQKQKERERIAKYKTSRKYTDSVARARKERADSITYVRNIKLEQQRKANEQKLKQMQAVRKQQAAERALIAKTRADSLADARERTQKLLAAKRKQQTDSLAKVKKLRSDSLIAKKERKLKELAKKYKTEDEKRLEAAMKAHKTQQIKYSNQLFLKKPWSMPRRIYQNTTSRYNYFYNARNRYNESIITATKKSTDDYSRILSLNQIDLDAASQAVGGNMDSVIKKCQTSIQIHDPRSKWFDDLYLLTGKAYYLKNDLETALSTFQFVASEYKPKPKKNTASKPTVRAKPKPGDSAAPILLASEENRKGIHALEHHFVRNDALLWMLRCYLQMDALNDALALAGILERDPNFPQRLRGDLSLLSAQLHLKMEDKKQAIAALQIASQDKSISKEARRRATYLLGQLQAEQGDYAQSTASFERVLKLLPDVDMDFFSRLNIAKNSILINPNNTETGEAMFTKILKDNKYDDFRDRAYLVLGQLQMNSNPDKAVENLNYAVRVPKASADVRMQAYRALADIYFLKEQYAASKVMYDSTLSIMRDNDTSYKFLDRRRNLLKDLVREMDVVRANDSLLALAKLTKQEQLKAVRKYIKQQQKAAEASENSTNNSSVDDDAANNAPTAIADWYFSNKSMMTAGKANFEKKWGTRPNIDNWRRRSAISTYAENQLNQAKEAQVQLAEQQAESSADSKEQQYLAQIPNTHEQKYNCQLARANAMYNIAVIYYAGLQNDAKATQQLEEIVADYPQYNNMHQVYYTAYLSYKRLPNETRSKYFQQLLSTQFSDHKLTAMANNEAQASQEQQSVTSILKYYDETYTLYKQNAYASVLPRIEFARSEYQQHALLAKFDLLSAMCLIQTGKKREGKRELETLISKYAGNEEATFAQDLLALLIKADSSLTDSTDVIKNLTASFEQNANAGFTGYIYQPTSPHYFMFVVRKIDERLTPTKAAFTDYNSMKHSLDKISTTLSLVDENTGILFFRKFADAKAALKYLREVQDTKNIYAVYRNTEVELAVISETNYEYFKNTRDLAGYLKFYKKQYK